LADTALTAAPTEVTVRTSEVSNPRFTPRELRLIQQQTGRTFSQIMSDEDSDEKFVVFAWLKLRRDGHPVDWEDMDDVLISISSSELDPTNGRPVTTSPPSAATGA
jgi:hypothetical protein